MNQFVFTASLAAFSSLLALSLCETGMAAFLLASGACGWAFTSALIPKISHFMHKKHIFGLDINKRGSKEGEKEIPECVGFAAAVAFTVIGMVVTLILRLWSSPVLLTMHIAVFTTIFGTILLGFADDMLDLPWRYKLLFPFFIVLPLVCVYSGPTSVYVIAPFSYLFGSRLELSHLYLLYITLLGIYQTNTINIYAGINGLEVGQSIVAACGMLLYFYTSGLLQGSASDYHYSIYLLVTFLGTTVALMRFNAYPARIFIGDTFCYFAGIVLAVASIWGSLPVT
jgi:UDP-N-acetylglucosamine--dolichyl-phosphate N-acetylglucosaminephosphotransferase